VARIRQAAKIAQAAAGLRTAVKAETADTTASEPDCGAKALGFALQILGLPADPAQIAHQSGKQALDESDLLRAARRFPVKARAHRSRPERLDRTPLPALAGCSLLRL
jgi:ABC-type bacteriocin/lantibiotic exporter with double-glycine peptidase domain